MPHSRTAAGNEPPGAAIPHHWSLRGVARAASSLQSPCLASGTQKSLIVPQQNEGLFSAVSSLLTQIPASQSHLVGQNVQCHTSLVAQFLFIAYHMRLHDDVHAGHMGCHVMGRKYPTDFAEQH